MNPADVPTSTSSRRILLLIGSLIIIGSVFGRTIIQLGRFSLSSDAFSYIPLIPVVSIFFFIRDRKRIFDHIAYSLRIGIPVVAGGLLLYSTFLLGGTRQYSLTVNSVAFLITLYGFFILCFSTAAFRKALFPLLFLLFIVPLPRQIEGLVVELFRAGSTEMVDIYFKIINIPFIREGDTFQLEQLRFCVADECSGINSGMSLLIVAVIAAKMFLKNNWVRLGFVLTVLPIGWAKNGMRIATLTLLGSYVNPDFLYGSLHRQGGRPFFALALLFLGGVLFIARLIEKKAAKKKTVDCR